MRGKLHEINYLKGFQSVHPNLSPCPGDQVQLQVTNQPETSGLAGLLTTNWSSLCFCKWNIEIFINTFWKRSTISNYKFTSLCYFTVPRLCRWKACWKHPRTCVSITGVFNQRPPQPCYTFVWDVQIVLVYLKKICLIIYSCLIRIWHIN